LWCVMYHVFIVLPSFLIHGFMVVRRSSQWFFVLGRMYTSYGKRTTSQGEYIEYRLGVGKNKEQTIKNQKDLKHQEAPGST
jgi:hypothetical protein